MSAALYASPLERVVEILDYHQHTDGVPCAMVVLEIDGNEPFECCIPVDELHADDTPERTGCLCGHNAGVHGELFGCWAIHPTGGLACTCRAYTPRTAATATEIVLEAQRSGRPVDVILARATK